MTLLLVVIYLSFISLGLPDSLLGSAWPSMYQEFGVTMSSAGGISMIVAIGTVISSLSCDRLLRKLSPGKLTLISVMMTAIALLGISFSNSYLLVCPFAVPLGLGAGCVDATLNNFVALHYQVSHMNWLHGFWGLGTIIGPLIISFMLRHSISWNRGYLIISLLQFLLVAILFISLPLWRKATGNKDICNSKKIIPITIFQAIKLPRAKATMTAFLCYCAIEQTAMLWGSSYMVVIKGFKKSTASGLISLFFIGITTGRMLFGFISMKLTSRKIVLLGQFLVLSGIICLCISVTNILVPLAFILIGLGCAPIFPILLHETPNSFGKEYSQSLMGIQMACAYIGTAFMPPIFGMIGGKISYGLFPVYLIILLATQSIMTLFIFKRLHSI